MSTRLPDPAQPIEQLKDALRAERAERVRELFALHPELKATINEPLGPFDSPAIVNAHDREMLDVLLDAGADINARSQWWAGGFGLLDSASPELAAHAIERGAKVDAHAAARLGMMSKLRELIDSDPALVHAPGGDGKTPLHCASTIEAAEFLLDRGAQIDARCIDHESTPAQYMVDDRQSIARYLVSRGCKTDILMGAALGDVDLVRRHLGLDPACIRMRVSEEFFPKLNPRSGGTIYGWTLGFYLSAHQVARKFGHDEILKLLFERSPVAVQLLEAAWDGDGAMVEALRAKHPGIAGEFLESDRRLIAHAARKNLTEAVRLMLESGLPVDARGQHQGMPLHWAAFHGNAEMARIVLRYSPPLEAVDGEFHSTPLGWAIHGSEHGWNRDTGDYAGVVEALIEAGAKRPTSLGGSEAVREVLRRHGVRDE
jgi:Ankyrin repeats (3 copies)/Ankyrin repeat